MLGCCLLLIVLLAHAHSLPTEPRPLGTTLNVNPLVRSISGRIIGGTSAYKGEFPWQVSLRFIKGGYAYHFCGGSVVNNFWIVTAAHCMEGYQASDLLVVLGEHNFQASEGSEVSRYISQVIVHERFIPQRFENDIALLRMQSAVHMTTYIQPIPLPMPYSQPSGNCVNSGWGDTNPYNWDGSNPILPSVLQKVTLPIFDHNRCNSNYGGSISSNMICAGYSQGGKSPCMGDSGGPLACRNSAGQYYLAGLVSWGLVPCGQSNYPGVFTKVSNYNSWITNKIGNI